MWDLYDDDDIAAAEVDTLGDGTPLIAWSNQLNVMLENGATTTTTTATTTTTTPRTDRSS